MNVIVIECDSWHIGYLGCFGNDWIRTPNLDAFSRRAVAFDNAYPENLPTIPTRTSWWTGKFWFPVRTWQPLPLEDKVLPELLWDRNVRSALITDVYHMHKPGMGYGRGFDEVVRIRGQEYDDWIPADQAEVDVAASPHHRIDDTMPQADLWRRRYEQYLRNRSQVTSPETTYLARTIERARRWLADNAGRQQPLFLWLDCFDPHEPWDPPEPYLSMYAEAGDTTPVLIDPVPGRVGQTITAAELRRLRQTYAGTITFVDHWLGKLFAPLDQHGYFEDSLILWMTDHGEPLGEHGIVRKCRPWLHEELVHTPWLLHLPGDELAGSRTDVFAQAPDVLPTILDFLGHPIPAEVHGQALLPVLRGAAAPARDAAYLGMSKAEWCLRTHDWAFLLPLVAGGQGDPPRGPMLFDRAADRWENVNVLDRHPGVAADLELKLRRFVEQVRARHAQ